MGGKIYLSLLICILLVFTCRAQGLEDSPVTFSTVGEGWANNSINTVIFRRNSLDSDHEYQFTAFYDGDGNLVLGKRKLGTGEWETKVTPYHGNVKDAHNTISITLDGDGYLHVSWDHHDNPLRYAKSKDPLSLELGERISMTGKEEEKVTYPEFHKLPDGNLIFLYRSGASGRGNLVMNKYDIVKGEWSQLHKNLIDGEGERNAYWQAYIDSQGTIHLSWVWRESWDVATNHDMAYARSTDGGITWRRSSGEAYTLPITVSTAEYAWMIPQKSSLINQTAMAADEEGNPYIVSYWAEDSIPQYHIIYHGQQGWKKTSPGNRKTPFYLGGGGTKRIPISRPQLLINSEERHVKAYIIFRDEERDNKITMAYCNDLENEDWIVKDLTTEGVGQWEPTHDISLWKNFKQLHLFVQKVEQKDGEGVAEGLTTPIHILQLEN
ncbi:BNR repeat-containing protein [Anditalea andensis]|uniref:Neuraminidase n=1 Tax=Anditalea andensis TaxID=1048983 RepID=A0A074KZ00_9BACT|nr:BNR repeat-containing protein [Anditalea andensis]KEO74124.1 neuraminidase [Anditalea andensis]